MKFIDEITIENIGNNQVAITDGAGKTIGVATVPNANISSGSVTQHVGDIDHDSLLNYLIAQHRIINDAGSSTTELLSASKILALISGVSSGIDLKDPVDTSTEGLGNITLSGEQALNGVLTSGSRVLVSEQTLGEDNGIYVTAAGAWTRATDADTDAEVTNGMTTIVDNPASTVYRHQYLLTTADPITLDVTPLTFAVLPDLAFGTTAGTATEGNDTRVPTQDENDALGGTDGVPSAANKYVTNSDSRLSDSRPPNGAASGDLAGTYPSPSVAALTTTTGPTSLTIGAIADGEVLTRSGSTIIGAAAGSGTDLAIGTQTGTTLEVTSSTGTNVTLPQSIAGGNAGLLAGADQTKLDNTTGTNSGDNVQATTSVSGIAELATQAEVNTGTNTTNIVTPDTLEDKTYGTFSGTTISDNATIKTALQELETGVEGATGTTNLSIGTKTATTVDINSDTGTNATIPEANTTEAGLLGADKWDEIVANTSKVSNVTTDLSIGTKTATTVDINSSDGTNATIPAATITEAGLLQATDKVKLNNLSGTNTGDQTITLTGDVTGTGTGSFATTIAAKAVDVAMLADGTDGELITWDAAGEAATVAAGTSGQALTSNGAGAAPTFQDIVAGVADGVEVAVRNSSGGTLVKGQAVYISGFHVGTNEPEVTSADSDAAGTMPAIGLVKADITNNNNGDVIFNGRLDGFDTSAWTSGNDLYVSGDPVTTFGLTSTKPTGTQLIQKVAVVLRSHASLGSVQVFGAGRSNDLPNLPQDNIWLGDASGVPQETTLASAILQTVTEVSGTAPFTTSSGTPVLVTGMTLTPASGDYLVEATGIVSNDASDNAIVDIYAAGSTAGAHAERDVAIFGNDERVNFATSAQVTVNGSQAIELRLSAAGNTSEMINRTMQITKIA